MVDPADTGMAALSRQRSYTILYNKNKVEVLATPSLLYIYLAQHICSYNQVANPDDLFTASSEEVQEEIQVGRPCKTLLSGGEIGRLEGYELFLDCTCNLMKEDGAK